MTPRQLELTISNDAVAGDQLSVCLSQPKAEVIPGSLNSCVFPAVLTVANIEVRADAAALDRYGLATADDWTLDRVGGAAE